MIDTYDIHDDVRLWIRFTPAATAATLDIRKPDGTEFSPTPTETNGEWSAVIKLDQAGVWRYRWTATEGVGVAEEGAFRVRRRMVGG